MSKLLTVKETSEALGCADSTIRRWLRQRRLPLVRCGRAVRVPSEAVQQFISANTIPACVAAGAR
jgi:excisionase family DNA binding protein